MAVKRKCTNCRNTAPKGHRKCWTCISRDNRKRNPMRYAYCTLKANAKRRGKEFSLTFDQFKKFAIETNYLRGKGKQSTSYSIDRIDNERGYTIDNIMIMSLADNSRKHTKRLHYDWQTRSAIVTTIPPPKMTTTTRFRL